MALETGIYPIDRTRSFEILVAVMGAGFSFGNTFSPTGCVDVRMDDRCETPKFYLLGVGNESISSRPAPLVKDRRCAVFDGYGHFNGDIVF